MPNVTIIGAGLSGRGMLGELFSHEESYHVTFVDNDPELVAKIRNSQGYHVTMTTLSTREKRVSYVTGYDVIDAWQETPAYHENLAKADLICTALMPDAFDDVISHLAQAIRLRRQRDIPGILHITLGANFVGLLEYYDTRLRSLLSGEDLAFFETHIALTMSVVNRKNLEPTQEERLDPLHVVGDDKSVLRVEDLDSLRAWQGRPGFFRLEKNLSAAMAVKIWAGNLVQCSMAFAALQFDIHDSYHASYHPVASRIAYYAAREGYYGVSREYGLPDQPDSFHRNKVLVFRNEKFSDDLHRIAREPIRKMGRHDRFIGPALLCLKYGKMPYFIAKGCAYGFLYYDPQDPQSCQMRLQIQQEGAEAVILRACQLDLGKPMERTLYELICNAYREIAPEDPLG